MKTKHLLIAAALPALFAACTNDDLDVVSNEASTLQGRKVVENVTLELGDGIESRLAYGANGYTWQANDQIGAMLMDDVVLANYHSVANPRWTQWFTLTDYIHTNYKFTRNAKGLWSTEAKMCEGNYFFVYPYEPKDGSRVAYTIKRDVQTLAGTDNASLMKAYASNNAFVGYSKVKLGDESKESLKFDMVPAFGATGITIKNTGTATYKIEKIVLRGSLVKSQATINPTTCSPAFQYSSNVTSNIGSNWKNTFFNVSQYTREEEYRSYPGGGLYDSDWSSYNDVNALKDVLDYSAPSEGAIEVFINGGNVVAPQKTINVIAMLQNVKDIEEATVTGGTWTNAEQIVLDIHTDKGLIRDIQLNCHYTATNGGLGSSNDDVVTNVLTDKNITAIGDGKSIMVTFDDTSLDIPGAMDIKGDDELANLIHWNANTSAPIVANLKDNVTITKAMYNELAASKIGTATINGYDEETNTNFEVTIASDVPAGALDRFTFTNVDKVYVNGTQTLAKAKTVPVEVKAGATLNVTGNVGFKQIDNYGTTNMNSKLSVAFEKNDDGSIKEYSKVNNRSNGVINVAAGKELTDAVEVTNCDDGWDKTATVNNQGIVRHLHNEKFVNNTGVIGTEAQVGYINEMADNSGTITNEGGKVFLDENTGYVYANGKSTTRMEENNGYIIITKLDDNDGNFLAGTMGYIVQEIAEPTNTDGVDVRANMLWLSSTLKVEKKDANGDYVNVNLNQPAKNGQVQIVATGANARIDGNGQKLTMSHITVNGGCKLVLNKVDVFNYVKDGSYAWIYMKGSASAGVATITINNNASLTTNVNEGGINASQENAYNVIDNNSSSTFIGVDDDAVVEG